MTNINVAVVSGRLVRDATFRVFDNGNGVINFAVACNRSVKENGEWKDKASFFECKYFTRGAEKFSGYLLKGTEVVAEGSLEQETWETNGQKNSRIIINAKNVQLGSFSKNNTQTNLTPPQQQGQQESQSNNFPEDLFF